MSCLLPLASSPVLQCQLSSRAGLQGWLAQTCHKQSGFQALVFSVQGCCCPLGRSRRGQVQTEAADPSCLELGEQAAVKYRGHLQECKCKTNCMHAIIVHVIPSLWRISCSSSQSMSSSLRHLLTRSVLLVKKGQLLVIAVWISDFDDVASRAFPYCSWKVDAKTK